MTSAPTPPVFIYPDYVYAPILPVLLGIMTPDERGPIFEILRSGARSESKGEAS